MPGPDAASAAPIFPVVVHGLSRSYGPVRALDEVDLTLRQGEFLTIFGPNGAGKTTLLKILAGLVKPTSGSVTLFGLSPRDHPDAVKRRLGLIAHAGLLYGGLTARDNLRFYARLYDLKAPDARADALLDEVGLADRAGHLVRGFSRGMQQRLSIARALIHDPDLVLLDEPYTGLDQHASRMLRGILDQVRGQGRTVVMVTHHLDEGLQISSRIAIMARGRIAWDAPTASLSREALEKIYLDVVSGGRS
jgi:heme exporter protein A